MDLDVAILNATLKEDVYLDPPTGYPPVAKDMALKLSKALYELEWNETLDTFLRLELKMTRLKTEQCIYVRFNEGGSEYIAGTTQEAIMKFISAKFEWNDLGKLDRILNM